MHKLRRQTAGREQSSRIHPQQPAYPPEIPGPLHPTAFGGAGRGATLASRRCFILGSALRLHDLADKSSIWTGPALHEGLGFVDNCVRQSVGAKVADRE